MNRHQTEKPEKNDLLKDYDVFWAAVLFICLGMLFFWREIIDGRMLVSGEALRAFFPWRAFATGTERFQSFDQILQYYPWKAFSRSQFLQGVIPLWNPYNFCGSPLIGNIQAQILYPIDLPFTLFCFQHAFLISGLMKFVIAGTGMTLLMRQYGMIRPAAALAGILYAFSGFIVIWLGYPHATISAWLPLILLFTEKLIERPVRWRGIGLAVALGLQYLAGHAEMSFYLQVFTVIYFLTRFVQSRNVLSAEQKRKVLIRFTVLTMLAIMTAMVLYLPFLEYFTESAAFQVRSGKSMGYAVLNPLCLIGFLIPDALGSPVTGGFKLPLLDPGAGHLTYGEVAAHFIGIWAIFFLFYAILSRWRNAVVRFYVYTLIVIVCVLFGVPGIAAIMDHVPLLNLGFHLRTVFLLNLAMAVLAGTGLHAFAIGLTRRKNEITGIILFATGVSGGVALFRHHLESKLQEVDLVTVWNTGQLRLWIVLGLGAIILLTSILAGKRRIVAGMLPLMFLELFMFGAGYNPSVKPESLLPPVAVAQLPVRDPELFRVTGMGPAFFPNGNLLYTLSDCRGYDALSPARMYCLLEQFDPALTQLRNSNNPLYLLVSSINENMLKLLNIKYICLPPGSLPRHFCPSPESVDPARFEPLEWIKNSPMPIYRYADTNPRFKMMYDIEVIPDQDRTLMRLADTEFDPGRQMIISRPLIGVTGVINQQSSGQVDVIRYQPGTIELVVHTDGPGVLLASELFFPGWHASCDEIPVEIIPSNYALMGLEIPAGSHQVSIKYRPVSFLLGLFLSLIAILVLAAIGRIRPE